MASLGVEDADRWMLALRRSGVGPASIRNQLMVLRAALHQAVKWDWIERNPAALAKPPARPDGVRAGMPDDVVAAVIAAAPHQAAAVAFRISAVTGARRAELAALRWEDVRGDRLVISGQIVARPGPRPSGPPVLERRATKTRQIRTVSLDAGTVAAIGAWRQVHGELSPWLLAVGERPPSPDAISWWRRAREASGIDATWRLHDLRHWSASTGHRPGYRRADRGQPPRALQPGHDPRGVRGCLCRGGVGRALDGQRAA